jgi:hypothetical protein
VFFSINADENETQAANWFFTETGLPTFPYRIRGIMHESGVSIEATLCHWINEKGRCASPDQPKM